MLGIVLGVVSLGISLILSGIAYVLTILKNYEDSVLTAKENSYIAVIWIVFGVIIILYGYIVSSLDLSHVINILGWIYLDFGILFGLYNFWIMVNEKSFYEKVRKATLDFKSPRQNNIMALTRVQIAWGILAMGAVVMIAGSLMMLWGFGTLQMILYSVGLAVFLFGTSQVANMRANAAVNERLDRIETAIKDLKTEK